MNVTATTDADAIVVGAGPAGSSAAYWLAQAGLDVLLLEKAEFPREKVCGDGLTPRASRELVAMGIDTSPEAGWLRNKGLRIRGGGQTLHLPWPDLASFPDYGLVRRRADFDEMLARHAEKAGAHLLTSTPVTGPITNAAGRVIGVTARNTAGHPTGKHSAKTEADGDELRFHAPLVLAADGNSSRFGLALGRRPRKDRPMGVAVRTYYTSPRHEDDWLESWLELRDGDDLLPGYGWIFGMGDGTSNVGLGILNTTPAFQTTDYRDLLRRWLDNTPEEWGYREANRTEPIRGAALPMGFNRTPHYARGVMLLGDSGGMVNPFNGEGIAYAMESGRIAAETAAQALARTTDEARELALTNYAQRLKVEWGGYYTLGRVFVKLIGDPRVMKLATERGLSHPALMRFTLKLLANLTDPKGGDAHDKLISALARVAPAA